MADAGEPFDPEGLSCRRSPATTPTPTARCCRCRSTARRRSCTTTRTSSRRPGSTPTRRRRPGPRGRRRARSSQARGAAILRLHHRLDRPGSSRELRRLAQPADRHARRTASAASTPSSSSTARCMSSTVTDARRLAEGRRPSTMAAARGDAQRRSSTTQECAMLHELVGGYGRRHRQRQGLRVRLRLLPYYAGRRRARRRTRSSAAPPCGC